MSWSYYECQIEHRPAQVLIDDRFRATAPVRELERLAWFAVYCLKDPGAGFWHPDETPSLDAVEENLIQLCDQHGNGWAAYVMRIDTRGIREYYFYCGKTAVLKNALSKLRAKHPDYRVEFEETTDATWNRYKTFLQ